MFTQFLVTLLYHVVHISSIRLTSMVDRSKGNHPIQIMFFLVEDDNYICLQSLIINKMGAKIVLREMTA